MLLVVVSLLTLLLANSPLQGTYYQLLSEPMGIYAMGWSLEKPLQLWINDGLMALFFFVIGLEIKREVLVGQLSTPSQIVLPIIAAIAGIVLPALIYYALNAGQFSVRGWAIPSATDIVFALAVFSLFKARLPLSLKLFLLSVAIFDDIGAIIIIALFYSADLSTPSLWLAAVAIMVLGVFNRSNLQGGGWYFAVGFVVWLAVLKSGVHATLAGFVVALFIPLSRPDGDRGRVKKPLLFQLEHSLHPWVTWFILPLFAFANVGVDLSGLSLASLNNSVTLGIVLGLVVGKQLGIFLPCVLAVKMGWAQLPKQATWGQLYAVAILCGVGFTMSLFIGTLAFESIAVEQLPGAGGDSVWLDGSQLYLQQVKLGVLLGSLISALLAAGVLWGQTLFSQQPSPDAD